MKQWLKKRKGRGFTLVELLIVIVIIGILAGSLLLVLGAGTDKANATKVISDMRTLKAAMLMYYADNNDFNATGIVEDLVPNYLERNPTSPMGAYSLSNDEYTAWIVFTANAGVPARFIEILDDLSPEAGIVVGSGDNSYYAPVAR